MTEKPFIHDKAYANVKLNFIFQEEAAQLILKVINKKGIINLGGPTRTIYNFAKKYNKNIKGIKSKNFLGKKIPLKHSMNINKLKKILND